MVSLCPERAGRGPRRPQVTTARCGVKRPLWWREVAFIAVGYLLYTVTRNAAPLHLAAAQHHATVLYGFERRQHIDLELTLNQWLSRHQTMGILSSYYYATLHFVVTLGVLIWAYRWHPEGYRRARTIVILSTLAALYLFWAFPLAPPRLTDFGFADTITNVRLWGGASWDSPSVASVSNEYAAMPSLHVAWSLWSAAVVVWLTRNRVVRLLAPAYPLVTLLVVLATGNHFVLDAVGAVGVLAVAVLIHASTQQLGLASRLTVLLHATTTRLGLGRWHPMLAALLPGTDQRLQPRSEVTVGPPDRSGSAGPRRGSPGPGSRAGRSAR
ncbi:MAG: inositol phosphorylceramide synthase [Pseudonocardiales bacterium]|nr:MAG: inositol phosphorylceramide synthase [Pseudonocardiales bacterium]